MTILNSNFTGYKADLGAAICNWGGDMSIEQCLFENNEADHSGGALANDGSLQVVDSRFEKNKATIAGGAILNLKPSLERGRLRLVDSHLEGNTAPLGGAIQNWGDADLSIEGTQFKNNKASWGGGAISDYSFKFDQLFGTKYTSNGNKYDGNTPFDYWGCDIDLACVVSFLALLVACCCYFLGCCRRRPEYVTVDARDLGNGRYEINVPFDARIGSVLRFRNDTTGALVLVPLPRDTGPGATLHCNARGVVEGAGGGGGSW